MTTPMASSGWLRNLLGDWNTATRHCNYSRRCWVQCGQNRRQSLTSIPPVCKLPCPRHSSHLPDFLASPMRCSSFLIFCTGIEPDTACRFVRSHSRQCWHRAIDPGQDAVCGTNAQLMHWQFCVGSGPKNYPFWYIDQNQFQQMPLPQNTSKSRI